MYSCFIPFLPLLPMFSPSEYYHSLLFPFLPFDLALCILPLLGFSFYALLPPRLFLSFLPPPCFHHNFSTLPISCSQILPLFFTPSFYPIVFKAHLTRLHVFQSTRPKLLTSLSYSLTYLPSIYVAYLLGLSLYILFMRDEIRFIMI